MSIIEKFHSFFLTNHLLKITLFSKIRKILTKNHRKSIWNIDILQINKSIFDFII